jgi:benzoyl-CoA reductase/2-hydroxyglutaryl-CoA dehydratase subunit BcrC/BadD/HgdB
MRPLKDRVGITSTIPVEILFAAGCAPVDLNNVFISSPDPQSCVEEAERWGLPRNVCTWVKGLFSTILTSGLRTVIGVVQGDCSHMVSMLEALMPQGIEFIAFAYSYEKTRQIFRWELQKLMSHFNVQWDQVLEVKNELDQIRKLAFEIDRRTWMENAFDSRENFNALINCTDFKSDPDKFRRELQDLLASRPALASAPAPALRLGLLGVPGVITDFYDFIESEHARVVFHEVARQFAMPDYTSDLLEQYLNYTYPYSIFGRIQDIQEQSRLRQVDGYIHYVQSFCHHQMEDVIFRKNLTAPILTLEGDHVGPMDGRTRTRLEAFLHMVKQQKQKNGNKP